jgi:hypothetical protein
MLLYIIHYDKLIVYQKFPSEIVNILTLFLNQQRPQNETIKLLI